MNAQRLDVSAVLTAAVSELVTAAQEYLVVERMEFLQPKGKRKGASA